MRTSWILTALASMVLGSSFGQLPKKLLKMEGVWTFKSGIGFDEWKLQDNKLLGSSYRISRLGDTLLTDRTVIEKTETGVLIHTVESERLIADTIQFSKLHFVGSKRKLSFVNIDGNNPFSVAYKFGFLNKNKLRIRIRFGINSKETELVMFRSRD